VTLAGGRVQNPHPLLVHFPIAFLLAFGAATLLSLVVHRPGLTAFARACLFLGTAAAAVTVVSGFLAEQSVARVAAARGEIEEHRTFGYVVLGLAASLSALAAVAPRFPARAGQLRVLEAVGAVAIVVFVFLAAEEGGELVHEHGVGTKLTAPGGPLHEPATPGGERGAPEGAPAPTGRDFR
jgi:uncharacterized membrane protein